MNPKAKIKSNHSSSFYSEPRTRWTKDRLHLRLAAERQDTSLMEKELVASLCIFDFRRENWLSLWCDLENKRSSDCGTMEAIRAITITGDLLWMVRSPKKKHDYHSLAVDHFDAMEEAASVWRARSEIRKNHWTEIQRIAGDLRGGRIAFDLTLDDVEQSPLCALGARAFLRRFGLAKLQKISGRLAGFLMLIEPQVGFVIHEAAKRAHSKARTRKPVQIYDQPADKPS